MHYNPLAYIKNEADILKFVNALISNTKGEGKEGDPFWTKAETLLYCALIAYIIFEGPAEDRNMNTLVDMISGMEVKEDDDDFMNAVDYMFKGLEKRKPNCFAVKQGGQMARAKNRGYQQFYSPSYTIRRWKMGGYIRLSKEDLKKAREGKDDSNSVKNQRDLLGDFYRKHIDEFESMAEYVDDGHTGTDADREDFQRLLADVMNGKINCVIVKDLSRFARNYSDAGSLIDNLFVQMGVRFISLAENVDSYRDPDSVSSIIVPITNVMNDQYCYQTSKKIRQVFDYKRRSGQYIGSFAPYGYIKDPKDKHQLIVDEEAAEIVKQIYSLCLQGTTKRHISFYLNEHGIPSPTAYRRAKGLPVSSTSDDPMWGDRVIWNILTNPIYTGDLVQGRRRVKSYKVHEIEAVPEEEWVIVPDTHEAIIDKESFEKVQLNYPLGIIEIPSPCGNPIRVYDLERTLCDLLRGSGGDIQIINPAMKRYVVSKDRDIHKLLQYAQQLRVQPKVQRYLEILL